MRIVEAVVLRSLRRRMRGGRSPMIAGHKLLYSCNLRCAMCPFWRRMDENLLTLREEVKMMESLAKAGVSFMGFEGGEPLLRRDVPEILRESHERFHTSMVTNGLLLKRRIGEIHRFLDFLFVSVDGIGEIHDKIRGMRGAFQRTIEGIEEASKYVSLAISSTITEENVDQVERIVELAERLKVGVNFQVAYDYSTAESLSPSRERLRSALERLLRMKEEGAPIVNSRDYFKAVLDSWFHGNPWRCKPWLLVNVDPQGRVVLPCYVLNEYKGGPRVWEVDLLELWQKVDWEKYEECNRCALSCYLEPSLFSFRSLSMVRERIVEGMMSYLSSVL
jgi:radical SAM family uncharacterized protein